MVVMTLSEAIRLGTMCGPQIFGDTWGKDGTGGCAMGAALYAIGEPRGACYSRVLQHWPITGNYVTHPVSGQIMLVMSAIRLLNDEHHWTREQIADWVETVEGVTAEQVEPALAVQS